MLNFLHLLDELQTLARNGLHYAQNPYDQQRYARLFELACLGYATACDLPPPEIRQRLSAELGHITPKIGGNAAVFDNTGRILLQQRADDRRWCLPCGWVEPGEAPVATAIRETREETGLEVQPVCLVDVFTRLPSTENGPHTVISILYLCAVIGGTLRCSHEGLALQYWPLAEVPGWHKDHYDLAVAAQKCWHKQRPPS
jgi:8-oxo-dGTP pyrophosphatase MutT (NUDIX family)